MEGEAFTQLYKFSKVVPCLRGNTISAGVLHLCATGHRELGLRLARLPGRQALPVPLLRRQVKASNYAHLSTFKIISGVTNSRYFCELDLSSFGTSRTSYTLVTNLFHFLLTLIIVSVLYAAIYMRLRNR